MEKKKYLGFAIPVLLVALTLLSCKTDVPTSPGQGNENSNGTANFTKYVAIGSSLTAGMQNAALYESAQIYSYPNLIAQQVGIVDFQQPIISDPGIGGRLRLTSFTPTIMPDPSTGVPKNATLARAYNNLGIPASFLWIPNSQGQPISDFFDSTDFAAKAAPPMSNPFFQVVLRNPALGKSVWAQVKALQPTFVTFSLGFYDALAFAGSGGTTPLIPQPIFSAIYTRIMDSLKTTGAQIVVANIPDVTQFPLVTTVPWFAVDQNRQPILSSGNLIPLVGQTKSALNGRALHQGDYVTLKAQDLLRTGYGFPASFQALGMVNAGKPLPDAVVLDVDEIASAKAAFATYNQSIQQIVSAKGIFVVDINKLISDMSATSVELGGETFGTGFISGWFFSLDGAHPSSKGMALVANEFIKVINQKFGANTALVNTASIPGLTTY
jgi:hypothetical protein